MSLFHSYPPPPYTYSSDSIWSSTLDSITPIPSDCTLHHSPIYPSIHYSISINMVLFYSTPYHLHLVLLSISYHILIIDSTLLILYYGGCLSVYPILYYFHSLISIWYSYSYHLCLSILHSLVPLFLLFYHRMSLLSIQSLDY